MDRRIIIIHSSAIVQKGLQSILRDAFADDFLLLNSINDLQDYSSLSDLELIVLVDEELKPQGSTYFKQLEQANNKVIMLPLTSSKIQNNSISIYSSSHQIVQAVKNALRKTNDERENITELSDREQDVLKLVALGYANKEIADKLFISIHTVISHRKNITEKLGIKSISGLTVYAILNKLIDTENIDPSSLI